MDRKMLIKNLKQAFSNSQFQERYSEIWLSYLDFGDLSYDNKKFALNVRTKQKTKNTIAEIDLVFNCLKEDFKEELSYIHKVLVHPPKTGWEQPNTNFVLYDDEEETD